MRFTAACAVAAALFALPAAAADTDHKTGAQQSKFATCAHESKGLRGEEHQKFMSECLKGHDTEGVARKEKTHRADDDTGTAGTAWTHDRGHRAGSDGRPDVRRRDRRARALAET